MTIEEVCGTLRNLILTALPPYLRELEDADTELPDLADEAVRVGYVDIERNTRSRMCFIVPDAQAVKETSVAVDTETTTLEVFFFVRKAPGETLFRQAMRYAGALKNLAHDDWSAGGAFSQWTVTGIEYFDNVENAAETIRATCVSVAVVTESE